MANTPFWQCDVGAPGLAGELRDIHGDDGPHAVSVIVIGLVCFERGTRRDRFTVHQQPLDMACDRLAGGLDRFVKRVSGREAAGKVRYAGSARARRQGTPWHDSSTRAGWSASRRGSTSSFRSKPAPIAPGPRTPTLTHPPESSRLDEWLDLLSAGISKLDPSTPREPHRIATRWRIEVNLPEEGLLGRR